MSIITLASSKQQLVNARAQYLAQLHASREEQGYRIAYKVGTHAKRAVTNTGEAIETGYVATKGVTTGAYHGFMDGWKNA